MEIYKDFSPGTSECGFRTVATLGAFDGLHLGHRNIIDTVNERAEQSGMQSVVLTFENHPISVIDPESTPKLLTTYEEKIEKLNGTGIDAVFVIVFTKRIAEMSAEQFISEYLVSCLGMKTFVLGYDHRFGREGVASPEKVRKYGDKYGFKVEIVKPYERDGIVVKSSAIRSLISDGSVESAAGMLGEDYSISGTVVEGRGIGLRIGFPTANILPTNPDKLIPAGGVYGGWIDIEDGTRMETVMFVGQNPTFGNNAEHIEAHIPGFEGILYGRTVRAGFVRRLRDTIKFKSKDELKRQIANDIIVFITKQNTN